MRPLCLVFNLWMCSLYFFGAALAFSQDLVPQFYNSSEPGTITQYPIYFFANFDEFYSTSSNTSNRTNKVTWIPYGAGGDSVLGDLRKRQLMRAILDYEGFNYCPLSDFVDIITVKHGSNDYGIDTSGNGLLVDAGRYVQTTFYATDTYPYQNFNNYLAAYTLKGYVFYRPNTVQNYYDVFYYFFLAPASPDGASANSNIWQLRKNNTTSTAYLYPTHTELVVDGMKTYQFYGTFTAEITNNSFDLSPASGLSKYSLPLDIDELDGQVVFATNSVKNYYWATWADTEATATTYPSLSTNFAIDAGSGANVSLWPYYSSLSLRTASQLIPFGSNDNLLESRFLFALDTDSGGMRDVYEWFQTKHDVLNPADDEETTEEIEPEIPEPEEGEYVVDVGKDTVERYDRYWDDQLGDDEELPELTPPTMPDLPNYGMREFYFDQVTVPLQRQMQDEFQDSEFKSTFDSTFTPLGVGDNQLTWTINPSVQNSFVNMPLPSVTLAPSTWINDPTYGPIFQTFRSCLLLVEFLYFIYKMYKLAVSSISGGAVSADNGGEDDD